ncbi:MAG: ribose-phosphate diphosphokinase [Conexivisphaerales archaeon]
MLIVPGSGSFDLASKVSRLIRCDLLEFESRSFPDGEKYIRIKGDCRGEAVYIIQSMYKNPSDFALEYVFLVDAVIGAGAEKVIGVFPYLPYLRQDTRFKVGEALSSKVFIDLLESSATSMAYVVDPHLHRFKSIDMLFNIPAFNISAMPDLAEYVATNYELHDTLVVAPDEEAEQWASLVANRLGLNYVVATKTRFGDFSVEINHKDFSVNGKDVIIVDDMVSTGGTLSKMTTELKNLGAENIIGLVTHGLFVNGAYEKIISSGMKTIITTDTVPNDYSLVSVAPLIARSISE